MDRYIDSDKLIAEIERRIEETKSMKPTFDQFWAGPISAFKGCLNIIYSLKQEQPEWSEEDKVMLNNIIWSIHMKSIKPLDEMDDESKYKKYENFLKSLPTRFNPHPHWKPSEEQMKALNKVANNGVLLDLFNDLLKLL